MSSTVTTRISAILLALALVGCATTKPRTITKTEIVEVKVPVVYKLERPERPRYLPEDTVPTYLNKLVRYTEKLEVIIDEHNRKQGN